MPRKQRYRRLQGNSAYYPFGARKVLRQKQRRHARLLRWAGILVLCGAAALLLRQAVFRGGQPTPPPVPATAETATWETARRPTVTVRPATVDALAGQGTAESALPEEPQATATPLPQAEILPQYRELYEKNSDMVGWLRIDGTDIDYPVMQTPGENEYYLRRGFDKVYATSGSLFLDERCSLGPDTTANWLIYGHNMSDGSMLGQLDRYEDPKFYAEHPTFTFDTLTTPGTWQVAAVIRTTLGADEWPYYTFFDADSRADWQRRVDAILDLALYDTGVEPEYGDQLLTLSTCGTSSFYTDERFAVLAVRVE